MNRLQVGPWLTWVGEYAPIYAYRRWRYQTIKFDPTIGSNISALAFGVWYPDGEILLMADKGVRDWGDHRVVVPIDTSKENN